MQRKPFIWSLLPFGDQTLYLLPIVTTDELDDLHNLEHPSCRQEVVHAAKDIPQAEQQHGSLNQYLAVEGDMVAAPIPIPPQSHVERTYVGSYRLNAGPRRRYVDLFNTSKPEVSGALPNMWDLMGPRGAIPDLKKNQDYSEVGEKSKTNEDATSTSISAPVQEAKSDTIPPASPQKELLDATEATSIQAAIQAIPNLVEDQDGAAEKGRPSDDEMTSAFSTLAEQEVTSGTKPTGLATMEAPHLQPLIEEEVVEPVTNVVTATLSDMLLVETAKQDPVSPGSMKAVASTERAVSTKNGAPTLKTFCKSWLRWIFPRKKEVHLPDDTKKSIFWDEAKQRWVDHNEPEEETKAVPPPPMGLPLMPLSGSQTGSGGPASGPPTNGPPANMFRKRAGTDILM